MFIYLKYCRVCRYLSIIFVPLREYPYNLKHLFQTFRYHPLSYRLPKLNATFTTLNTAFSPPKRGI